MKEFLVTILAVSLIVPQVVFAAWWNPFSWFKKTTPVTTDEGATRGQLAPILTQNTSTSTFSNSEEIKIQSSNNKNSENSNVVTKKAPTTSQLVKLSNSQIIQKVKPAVVYISTSMGSGSGMIISTDGYILTNAHVVKGVLSSSVIISTGAVFEAVVVGRDERIDIALLKISGSNFPKISFGDSARVEQGDNVFTLGYPFGIKGDVSFKEGTISRRLEDAGGSYFEISAEVHPGNSGGPLVNQYGQVIGINTAVLGESIEGVILGEAIKLAIPVNIASALLPDLKAGINVQKNKVDSPLDKEKQSPEQKSYWDKWSVITKDIEEGLALQKTGLDLVMSGAVKTSGLYIQKSLKPLNESLELLKAGYIPENRRSHLYMVTSVEFLILASEELQKNYEIGEKSQHYDKAVNYIDQYMYYRTLSNDNLKRF